MDLYKKKIVKIPWTQHGKNKEVSISETYGEEMKLEELTLTGHAKARRKATNNLPHMLV